MKRIIQRLLLMGLIVAVVLVALNYETIDDHRRFSQIEAELSRMDNRYYSSEETAEKQAAYLESMTYRERSWFLYHPRMDPETRSVLNKLTPEAREVEAWEAASAKRRDAANRKHQKWKRDQAQQKVYLAEKARYRVILKSNGRTTSEFDFNSRGDRERFVKWYNLVLHQDIDRSYSEVSTRAYRNTDGEIEVLQTHKSPGVVAAPKMLRGLQLILGAHGVYNVAEEAVTWGIKRKILERGFIPNTGWATLLAERDLFDKDAKEVLRRLEEIRRDPVSAGLNRPLVYVPIKSGKFRVTAEGKVLRRKITPKELREATVIAQSLKLAELNDNAAKKRKAIAEWEELLRRQEIDALLKWEAEEREGSGSGSDSADRPDINRIPKPVRDKPDFPPQKIDPDTGPHTRHPLGPNDGPQTGHPDYKSN